MTWNEALIYVVTKLGDFLGPLLGFVSAWGLFELQEFRKRRVATQVTRELLVVELRWLESALNLMFVKWAFGNKNFKRGVHEFRWFLTEGIKRPRIEEIPAEVLEKREAFLSYPDEKIAEMLAQLPPSLDTQALELPLTAINSAIGTPTSARLSAAEMRKLVEVRWQVHMLTVLGQRMNEFYRMTFTVSDVDNHKVVMDNHAYCRDNYRQRAGFLLDYVRSAITELDKSTC